MLLKHYWALEKCRNGDDWGTFLLHIAPNKTCSYCFQVGLELISNQLLASLLTLS